MSNPIIQQLQQQGFRITKTRAAIVHELSDTLIDCATLHRNLKNKGHQIDLVTIYRTLEILLSLSLVNKSTIKPNLNLYELTHLNHHHHLACDSCGKIEKIRISEKDFLDKIKHQTNFQIKRHSFDFFGLCSQCQAKNKLQSS